MSMSFICKRVSWPTYLLVCLFGIGSWIAINGVWVELPLLVDYAPEKWDLPSYLAVITQLANVGPLLYSLGNYFAPDKVYEKPVILFITTIGSVSCFLLAFFWDSTSKIGQTEHSVALFALTFTLALVDCTSSVVFLTFMSILPTSYMSALFVGETMSGMLPAFVALGQGIEKDKNCSFSHYNDTNISRGIEVSNNTGGLKFRPAEFFFFLCAMMVVCGLSFLGLNYLPFARKQHVIRKRSSSRNSHDESQHLLKSEDDSEEDLAQDSSIPRLTKTSSKSVPKYTIYDIAYLLVIQAWINCLSNGVLTSVQSYAIKPYGNMTYHLVATLSSIGSALTCFVSLWIMNRSSVIIIGNTVIYTILSGYVMALAVLSPNPPLHYSSYGSIIIIIASITSSCLVSYTKLAICSVLREKGQRALFWCGISIQVGSFIGAVVMFPLVNILRLFHGSKSC